MKNTNYRFQATLSNGSTFKFRAPSLQTATDAAASYAVKRGAQLVKIVTA